jgi:hypothetical protein
MQAAQARGAEAAREEGARLAGEVLEAVAPHAQGVHLSAPSGDVHAALGVIQSIRVSPAAAT